MSTPSVLSSPDKKDIDEAGPTSKKDDLKATKTESSEENITDEGTTDKNHSDNEEEEMEDLFGGEDENEEATSDSKDADNIDAVEESNEDDETKKSEGNEEENLQRAALTLSRHPRSHTPMNDDVIMFNLPRFISVDPEPFSPTNFEEQLKEFIKEKEQEGEGSKDNATTNGIKDSIQFRKLQLLNTIRWRYAKTPSGELYKQSNAKIIEWEDGTMSLKVGNEFFEIKFNRNEDNILAFQGGQVLIGAFNVNKSIKVLPPSTNSIAHKILASTIQNNMKLRRTRKINTIVTKVDPELKARENEKALREIEKARRKQDSKIQQAEEKLGRRSRSQTAGSSRALDDIDIGEEEEEDDDYSPVRRSGKHGLNADGYENDDFVVDDEDAENDEGEEEESAEDEEDNEEKIQEAAERLKKVKEAGSKLYEEKQFEPSAGEKRKGEKIEDDDDEEDEDGAAIVSKKRRVILEDDDDE
ncbi:DEBR0S5_01882g1_1 [Brettanomyces bruxellensis]|uniref:DEBR0S5_01882g1_1 n=1 Tax=Dekkera bruxellensis TaxID=5007 RepID=A0A7D9H1N8_DEKBR|nr:DEBR0S5_01882g1_1 [Brettanomyces bruxellensis]